MFSPSGLYGADDKEAAIIDMLNDQQEDLRLGFLGVMYFKPVST